jgi:two-component system phosphate regulon sensor histidine kinase PhoR
MAVQAPPQQGRRLATSVLRGAVVIWLAPLVAIAVGMVVGGLGYGAAFAALLVGGALSVAMAYVWARRLRAVARWLDVIATGSPLERPSAAGVPAVEDLLRPALEVARGRRRAERRAAALERMLDTVVEALPDPIIVVDHGLIIRRANQAAVATFDLPSPNAPLGRALRDPAIFAAVNVALAGGESGRAVYNPVSDRLKQFLARVEPVDLGDGSRGVLVALREQTEQVLIERMRSDFVANASHEIRTPLASLIGFIETLRGPAKDDAEAREMFLATMAEEAGRMTRLVDDLLSLSQIELAQNRPPESLVDVGDLLTRVVESVEPVARQSGVTLVLDGAERLPPVRGDIDQLHQLFANLVDNAVKYGAAGKQVRIEAEVLASAPRGAGSLTGSPALAVTVVDFGEGIAPEHIPRLTERFYRIDKTRSRRIGGTGLGLAIVKHAVRRHRGHLAISSEPGRGSRFCVYLPVAP